MSEIEDRPPSPDRPGVSLLPVGLTVAAVLIWVASQTLLLFSERSQLIEARAAQDAAIQESRNLRAQFEAIAAKTVELAKQGNANAKTVVEQLGHTGLDLGSITATPAR